MRRGFSGNTGRTDFSFAGYRPMKIAVIQVKTPMSQGASSQNESAE